MKYVRMVQKGLIKEIDNEAVLAAYGIELAELASPSRGPLQQDIHVNTGGQLIVNESVVADHAVNQTVNSHDFRSAQLRSSEAAVVGREDPMA